MGKVPLYRSGRDADARRSKRNRKRSFAGGREPWTRGWGSTKREGEGEKETEREKARERENEREREREIKRERGGEGEERTLNQRVRFRSDSSWEKKLRRYAPGSAFEKVSLLNVTTPSLRL